MTAIRGTTVLITGTARGAHGGAPGNSTERSAALTRSPSGDRLLPPTLLFGVDDSMEVMQEEIVGPVLPVVTYRALEDAIAYVNARPRPLSLCYFDGFVTFSKKRAVMAQHRWAATALAGAPWSRRRKLLDTLVRLALR